MELGAEVRPILSDLVENGPYKVALQLSPDDLAFSRLPYIGEHIRSVQVINPAVERASVTLQGKRHIHVDSMQRRDNALCALEVHDGEMVDPDIREVFDGLDE